jgi:hypothetical protein
MASTLVKKVMLKIVADDGDTEAKLDKITAKARELGEQHPELKVKVDSAAASAKLAVLRKELKDTADDAGGSGNSSLRSRLLGLAGVAGVISGLGNVTGLFNAEASMGTRIMSGFSLATGLLEGPMSMLITGVGALSAGLFSAGAGAGIFGIVAKQSFSQVSANITALSAAQDKIAAGATGKALVADNKAVAASLKGLNSGQKQLVVGAADAELSWHNFIASTASGVDSDLAPALGMVPKLLALARPFLTSTEGAISRIVASVSTKVGSSGFIHEIDDFARQSGPDLDKTAVAAGHVAMGILGILHAFLPMSGSMLTGLDNLTGRFERWGQTLSGHSGFQSLITMAHADAPYVISILKNLGGAIVHLGSSMTGLSTFSNSKALLELADPAAKLVNYLSRANPDLLRMGLYLLAAGEAGKKLGSGINAVQGMVGNVRSGVQALRAFGGGFKDAEVAADAASGVMGTWGGRLSTVVSGIRDWGIWSKAAAGATKVWTGIQAAFDVVMDANPIGLIVLGIVALIAIIVVCVVKFKAFREFWIKLWADAKRIVGDGIDWIKSHWKLLPAILLGPLGIAVTLVLLHFDQMRDGAERLTGDVTGFFRSLPGRILGAVGDLGHLLWSGGVDLIRGLVGGIESMAMAPVRAVESIAHDAMSAFDAITGRSSPSKEMFKRGLDFAKGLELGITSGSRGAVSASARMAAAAVGAGAPHAGAAGTGGAAPPVLEIRAAGDQLSQLLLLILRNSIRTQGGDVQLVLGH